MASDRRSRVGLRSRAWVLAASAIAAAAMVSAPMAASSATTVAQGATVNRGNCAMNMNLCTEVADSEQVFGQGVYVGHDEPSALFYSNTRGAGNNDTYFLRLPKDPPRSPQPNGTGGTDNFQLHPAFWFGMAMCDDQSAPGPGVNAACTPDSDRNIFNSSDPASPQYVGKHPGSAFMEMQFYPPGWVPWPNGNSCAATQWCAALNIDSLSENQNTGATNNAACLNSVGLEPVNFAFITKNGKAVTPANPANNAHFNVDAAHDLFMNSGDVLEVHLFDTRAGFRVDITDLSSGQRGSMTASTANGFAQVLFQPNSTTCNTATAAYHPEYATSSEQTRVPWAAHTYNTAFSDEIGHFENCAVADPTTGLCTQHADGSPIGPDDNGCFNPSDSLLVKIGGCFANSPNDDDFDGASYLKDWPGTGTPAVDRATKPQPVLFTSPLINGTTQFSRVAFEVDLPRIEENGSPAPQCDRSTGANCVNPPPGAQFYPFYTTGNVAGSCVWQLGGANIPGTVDKFGGSSTTAFGSLLNSLYPGPNGQPEMRINNFRQVLPNNPCAAGRQANALASAS